MDTVLLDRMMEYVKEDKINSVVIVKNGYIVLEYYARGYDKNRVFSIHSCTKSIMSTLIGMLVDQGKIRSVDQPLSDFFPVIKSMPDRHLKDKILLKHALTMTIGLEWPVTYEREVHLFDLQLTDDPVRLVLEEPVVAPPGKVFLYNSGVSHLLSLIVSRITGTSAQEYTGKNLFDKIGIGTLKWSKDKQGNSTGYRGITMRPLDMARFGFLYLNNGIWDGKQLISKGWIKAATADQTGKCSAEFLAGRCGYQWWVGSAGSEKTVYFSAQGFGRTGEGGRPHV